MPLNFNPRFSKNNPKKMKVEFTEEPDWVPNFFPKLDADGFPIKPETIGDLEEREILIQYLPLRLNHEKIKELFCKYGEIYEVQTKLAPNVMGAQYAMNQARIVFSEKDSAALMIKHENMTSPTYLHRSLKHQLVKFYSENENLVVHDSKQERDNNIFIGNLPVGTTQKTVDSIFERFGKIIRSKVLSKPSTKPGEDGILVPGRKNDFICALVMFEDSLSAEMAIREMNAKLCEKTQTYLAVRLRDKYYLESNSIIPDNLNGLSALQDRNSRRVSETVEFQCTPEWNAFARPPYGPDRINLIKRQMGVDIQRRYRQSFL